MKIATQTPPTNGSNGAKNGSTPGTVRDPKLTEETEETFRQRKEVATYSAAHSSISRDPNKLAAIDRGILHGMARSDVSRARRAAIRANPLLTALRGR